jgi:hypothetical protein|tara:strand:+ start:294 stop:500 length:207 start_codon:yes stop_codon:yes gene_type:complete
MSKILDNNTLRDMTADEEANLKTNQDAFKLEKPVEQKIEERETLKASAKAKLVAGEPLTDEEADTIVL